MTIHFKCECLKEFHLSDEHANKLARCKNCQRIFRVPKPIQSDELQKITTISGPNTKLVMFKCECGKKYAVKQEAAGKKVKCKKCNKLIEIPHEGIKGIAASAETKDIEKKQDKKHNPLILYLLITLLTVILLFTITYGYFYIFKNNDIKEKKVVSLEKDSTKSDISEEEEDILDEKQLAEGLEKINALKQSSQEQIIKKEEIKELITKEEKSDKIDKSKSNIIDSAESPEKKIEVKKSLTIQPEKEIEEKKDVTIKSENEIDKKEKVIKPEKELEDKKNKLEKEIQKQEIQNISRIKPDVIEIKAAEKVKKEPKKYLKKQKKEIIIAKKDTSINLKGILNLRSKPKYLLDNEVRSVVEKYNFFDVRRNRGGYFANNFVDNRNGTITDRKTGLMWQKSGSSEMMPYNDADNYINELNKKQFAGFNDWRLPTLEELLTLTEQQTTRQGTYIAPIFSQKQGICISSDTCKYENTFIPWYASFLRGVVNCTTYNVLVNYYVRAVRNHSTIN